MQTYQCAFGAKDIDSIAGGATAPGTVKYYYFNTLRTHDGGDAVSTVPLVASYIYSVQCQVIIPLVSTPPDSTVFELEVSNDGMNFVKWTNGSIVANAGNTQYASGSPQVTGAATYKYQPIAAPLDRVNVGITAGGCIFTPKNCFFPYSRVKITAWPAATYTYVRVYYTIKHL